MKIKELNLDTEVDPQRFRGMIYLGSSWTMFFKANVGRGLISDCSTFVDDVDSKLDDLSLRLFWTSFARPTKNVNALFRGHRNPETPGRPAKTLRSL